MSATVYHVKPTGHCAQFTIISLTYLDSHRSHVSLIVSPFILFASTKLIAFEPSDTEISVCLQLDKREKKLPTLYLPGKTCTSPSTAINTKDKFSDVYTEANIQNIIFSSIAANANLTMTLAHGETQVKEGQI